MFALFLLHLKQGFFAGRGTESLENEDLERPSGMVFFYESNPSGKNRARGDFPIVI